MERLPVEIGKLIIRPHYLFHNQWALLTAGDYVRDDYNGMTIGWGALGTMWSKPFAFVAVRHSRYTFKFMEKYDNFTISVFPRSCHEALTVMGTQSGRDRNKNCQIRPNRSTSENGGCPRSMRKPNSPLNARKSMPTISTRRIFWMFRLTGITPIRTSTAFTMAKFCTLPPSNPINLSRTNPAFQSWNMPEI